MSDEGTSEFSRLARLRSVCTYPHLIPKLYPQYVPVGQAPLFEAMAPDHLGKYSPLRDYRCALGYSLRPGAKLPPPPGHCAESGLVRRENTLALPTPVLRLVVEAVSRERGPPKNQYDGWTREHQPLMLPLAAEEEGRQRYIERTPFHPDVLGPRFSQGLALYLRVVDRPVARTLRLWFDLLLPFLALCRYHTTVVDVFKGVEGWAKTAGDTFSHWKSLCGLALLGGYVPAPPLDIFYEDVHDWVASDPPPIGEALPGWADAFKWASGRFADGCDICTPDMTYDEYVLSGKWVRQGATDQGSFPVVSVDSARIGFRHNKDVMYLGTSTRELLDLSRSRGSNPRAMVKRETTKARAVVITDTPSYLRMAWLSTALERSLARSKNASVFFSGTRLAEMWEEIAEQSARPDIWKCPVDQSAFDHLVLLWMLETVLACAETLLSGPGVREIFSMVKDDLLSCSGVDVGDRTLPHRKGVLSGWRWTALLDTWVNFSQVVGSLKYLYDRGVIPTMNYSGWYFQGDDVRIVVTNPGVAVAVVETMIAAGLRINPSKTWLSPFRDEFLRQVGQNGRTQGYLARSIPALLWRNPINKPAVDWPTAARAASSRWVGLVNRGASIPNVEKLMFFELARLVPYPPSSVQRWAAIPSWAGGLGVPWLVGQRSDSATIRAEPITYRFDFAGLPTVERLSHCVDEPFRETVFRKCLQYVREIVDPYEPRNVFSAPRDEPSLVWEDPPGMYPPLGMIPYGAPPVCASWNRTNPFPNWFRQVLVSTAVESRDHSICDQYLTARSRTFSREIYRRHGRGTWADWMLAALDLPIKGAPGWDVGFLAARLRRTVTRYIRCYLAGAARWGAQARRASCRYFFSLQRHPSRYYSVVISG